MVGEGTAGLPATRLRVLGVVRMFGGRTGHFQHPVPEPARGAELGDGEELVVVDVERTSFRGDFSMDALFSGVVVLVLAVLAIWWGTRPFQRENA